MSYSVASMEEAKQELILSIARSQTAMARILESLADVSEHSRETAAHLAHNISTLTRYQHTMAQTVCGISLHRVYYGTPSPPWITSLCYQADDIPRGAQEDMINGNQKGSGKSPSKK